MNLLFSRYATRTFLLVTALAVVSSLKLVIPGNPRKRTNTNYSQLIIENEVSVEGSIPG